MIINRENKSVFLSGMDLEIGFPCPECGKAYIPNGTGPQSSGIISKILQGAPSELICGGIPARFHDAAYLLCPAGWRVSTSHYGARYEAKNRKQADSEYLRFMVDQHGDAKGLAKLLVRILARRNWAFVRLKGKSSYSHRH